MSFSQRYGYIEPSTVFIRERITKEIQNAICTCIDLLDNDLYFSYYSQIEDLHLMRLLKEHVWCYFLNEYRGAFYEKGQPDVIHNIIKSESIIWYRKLDLLEFIIECLNKFELSEKVSLKSKINIFINNINKEFKRLNFAYQIIKGQVVEITTEGDIKTIETAIDSNTDNVKSHLQQALIHYSSRPEPDFRASIKESISAVEAICNDLTGVNTLGKALNQLESHGVLIQPQLKSAFSLIYGGYTSSDETGVRHGMKNGAGEFIPTADEAYFMLIACSAFINYLRRKVK